MTPHPSPALKPEAAFVADPVELLKDLVRIDSVNPGLVPGGRGESALADFAGSWLEQHGLEVTRLEATTGRPSVVAVARGSGDGRSLMFNGHMDTVSLAGFDGDPLDPRTEDGRIYGRGTYDMKAGLAAAMVAAASAARHPHRGDILVALVADEEFGSIGTAEMLQQFTADAAIVPEPTDERVAIAHGGFVWFDVEIHGVAAHGSLPDVGVDAIAKAGPFLTALGELARSMSGRTPHPLLGTGNVHASLISGGEERSSYPAQCSIAVERRTVPRETADAAEAELRSLLEAIAAEDSEFSFTLTRNLERAPLEVARHAPIVQTVLRAARQTADRDLDIYGFRGWTDCALLQEAGIPAILWGIAGAGAHAWPEWIETDSLLRMTHLFMATALDFCNQAPTPHQTVLPAAALASRFHEGGV